MSYFLVNSSIPLTNSGSGFEPNSMSTVSFNALNPVNNMNIDTNILTYPSIDIFPNFATIADKKTTNVDITSDMLSYAFPFIASELIIFAIFL